MQEYGIESIYYIHPSEHNEEDEGNIEGNDRFDLYNRLKKIDDKGEHFLDKGYVQVGYWMFKFFNLKKDLKQFKECINGKLNLSNFDIKNEKEVKVLKDCYEKIKGNLNDTSLVVLHKPLVDINKCENFINFLPLRRYCCFDYDMCKLCRYFLIGNKSFAQVLTGDIDLKTSRNYKEFKSHYKNYLNKIGLFQIPHHGAKSNWNINLLNDLKNCYYWVVNAGKSNKYNHPSFKIFLDVIEKEKCFILVNESKYSMFVLKYVKKRTKGIRA